MTQRSRDIYNHTSVEKIIRTSRAKTFVLISTTVRKLQQRKYAR